MAPSESQFCRLCELSGHSDRMIWGEGNPCAPMFVILDNPRARENRHGIPFLCSTRETIQKVSCQVGINPDYMFVSYILKYRPKRAYDKPTARATCIKYIRQQLKLVKPKVVMCLGNVVCQSIFSESDARVRLLGG